MTFGRYRGHSVRYVVNADCAYALWLMSKPFFKQKYPAHYVECRRLLVKRMTAEIAAEEELREQAKLPPAERFKFVSAHLV